MATSARSVSPADIQNELNRIWESLETTNVARACLFNLIFYTQKNHRAPYIQRIAQRVVEKFPARVIFVAIDNSTSEDSLKTEVSILSSSKGEFDVACDYIRVEASAKANQRVPFVVLPHILPDLPIYLVWGEDLCQADPLCYQLEQFAGRLIVDSESTDNLPRFAQCLLDHFEKSGSDIADLNWARMEDWREMFSMAFYSKDSLNQIQRSKTIAITYNAQETAFFCHTHIQALYLQAWLACQLGWNLLKMQEQKGVSQLSYSAPHGTIEVTLRAAQHTNLPPGLILSAEIATMDQEHFMFERNLEVLHQMSCVHSTPDKCDLPFRYIFAKAESGHSLVKEICRRGTSEHFLKVLNFVKNMEGQACAR